MAEKLIQDPRITGTQGLKGLKGVDTTPSQPDYLTQASKMPILSGRQALDVQLVDRAMRGPVEYVGNADLGSSRYDKDITDLSQLQDLNESRAEIQPWTDKIGAGLLKATGIGLTTFASGVAGNLLGLLNVGINADNISNSESPWRDGFNAFISNPFSQKLQQINQDLETSLPNYYSKAEQEDPWQEHIFSANFIGDKFLKNLGFFVGAAYSGKVTAFGASQALGMKGVRDAFKGVVATAAGKELKTAGAIAKAYNSGDAFMDGVKLTADLGKAAKNLKYADWSLRGIGSISAAMGESRIQAITDTKSWFDYYKTLSDDKFQKDVDSLEVNLYNEHPEWFSKAIDEQDRTTMHLTNPNGIQEWEHRKKSLEEQHQEALIKLSEDRANMANVDFGLNVALLSVGDLWVWGRFLSGGYNSGRVAKDLVKGSLKEGYKAIKKAPRIAILKGLSNPLMEAQEEMTQSLFSEATGQKYASEFNDFYGAQVDPDAEAKTADWIDSMVKGFANSYGTAAQWEQGFIGGLTGMLGIPRIHLSQNAKGKLRPSLRLEGEMWENFRDASKLKKEASDMESTLNQWAQTPEKLNYYRGAVRHAKYQEDMDKSLDQGDNFNYKNAEHSQILSDALMFDKAGRIQDLYDLIDEASEISDEDIQEIRQETVDPQTGKNRFNKKTDEEVRSSIKKQVEDFKTQVDSYTKISQDLSTLYGDKLSQDGLEELIWTTSQIDNWESRFKSLYQNIGEKINSIIPDYESTTYFGKNKEKRPGLLTSNSPEELLNKMASSEVLTVLNTNKALLEPLKSKSLRNQQIYTDLVDLSRIYEARKKLIQTYSALSSDPQKLENKIQQDIQTVLDTHADRFIKSTKQKLSTIRSVPEFKELITTLNQDPIAGSFIPKLLQSLKEGSDEPLKEILKNYEDLMTSQKIFENILTENSTSKTPIDDQFIETIKTQLDNAFASSNTLEEAESQFINQVQTQEEPLQKALSTLLKKYKAAKKLTQLKNTSTKIPQEPVIKQEETSVFSKISGSPEQNWTEEEMVQSQQQIEEPKMQEVPEVPQEETQTEEEFQRELENTVITDDANSEAQVAMFESFPENYTSVGKWTNWTETEYDFNELKNPLLRKAVVRTNEKVQLLQQLGVYNFLNKGTLGRLLQENPNLPINFLVSTNPILKDEVLLAIKLTPAVSLIAQKDATVVPQVTQDGTSYQIIGTLGVQRNPSKDPNTFKNVDKFKENLMSRIQSVMDETPGSSFYADPQDTKTQIAHIYSGRLVKSTQEDPIVHYRPLTKQMVGNTPHWTVYLNPTDIRTIPALKEEDIRVNFNPNNKNPKEGSLWLTTQEADGRWYQKAVKILRFTQEEYPLIENLEAPLVQDLQKALVSLVSPETSLAAKQNAKDDIKKILVFPNSSTEIWFSQDTDGSGQIDLIYDGVRHKNIAGNIIDPIEKAKAILFDLQYMNLRFQVAISQLDNPKYMDKRLNSNILQTDLALLQNVNSSFDIYPVSPETGESSVPPSSENLYGQVGNVADQVNLNKNTIFLNGKQFYSQNKDNKIFTKEGVEITDQKTLDELRFLLDIRTKDLLPLSGTKDVFISKYMDGTPLMVKNGKVIEGTLDQIAIKQKAEKSLKQKNIQKESKIISNPEEGQSSEVTNFLESFNLPKVSTESVFSKIPITNIGEQLDPNGRSMDASKTSTQKKQVTQLLLNSVHRQSNMNFLKEHGLNLNTFEDFVKRNNQTLDGIKTQEELDTLFHILKECR